MSNAEILFEKRGEIIEEFVKSNIISRGEKFSDAPKNIEKSTLKKTKKSFLKLIKLPKGKLDSIKLKILRNRNLIITIDRERYTLSDINDLVNKIANKSINRDEAINVYNDIAEKSKKLIKLRQTKNGQKVLEIINSFKIFF